MSAPLPPVTLTTDFGTTDHYVAQMKGVIHGLAPGAPIVDVTHEIPPQDVRRAASLLPDLAGAFPPGTVHVAVVDPGVGSDRAILAVESGGQFYVAPDNGLLTDVLGRGPARIVELTNPRHRRENASSTFHGRDIMAPAAGHLVRGGSLGDLGPPFGRPPVMLERWEAMVSSGRIEAAIAWVDRFGNLITNATAENVAGPPADRVRVTLAGHQLTGLRSFYSQVALGEPLLLIGSSGRLEIAVNGGSAAERLGVDAGERVLIDVAPEA